MSLEDLILQFLYVVLPKCVTLKAFYFFLKGAQYTVGPHCPPAGGDGRLGLLFLFPSSEEVRVGDVNKVSKAASVKDGEKAYKSQKRITRFGDCNRHCIYRQFSF